MFELHRRPEHPARGGDDAQLHPFAAAEIDKRRDVALLDLARSENDTVVYAAKATTGAELVDAVLVQLGDDDRVRVGKERELPMDSGS